MSEVKPKRIYLVRHGESIGNIKEISQVASTPLSDTGHKQAAKVAERAVNLDFDLLVASEMLRAQETAGYIAEAKKMPVMSSPYFHEKLNPSHVAGLSFKDEIYLKYIQELEDNLGNPNWNLPGMESFNDLMNRSERALDFLIEREEQNILVVTHGIFLMYLVAKAIFADTLTAPLFRKIYLGFHADNTGITMLSYEAGKWRLITWNDHSHFAE